MSSQTTLRDTTSFVLEELAGGRPAVVYNGTETVLVADSSAITPSTVAFFVRHGSGLLVAALPWRRCDRLRLPRMWNAFGQDGPDYCVTVDAARDVTTGISATDRATTLRTLADPGSRTTDLSRPGHVMVCATEQGGVLARARFAEAAVDLTTLAGCGPTAVYTHLVSADGSGRLARPEEINLVRGDYRLPALSLSALRGAVSAWSGNRQWTPRSSWTWKTPRS